MIFYDCRVRYGEHITGGSFKPCPNIAELAKTMQNCGIAGALVYNFFADVGGINIGNDILERDIKAQKEHTPDISFYGAYTIVPSCTNETVPPDGLPDYMREHGFHCLRINPAAHKFLPVAHVIGDYLEVACTYKIPVMFDVSSGDANTDCGFTLAQADGIMRDFPELTAILFYNNVWPSDRLLRPMLKQYKNLYLNTAHFIADGVYEEYASMFGCDRLMHGSCFPDMYMSANILVIKNAEISEESKAKIASGNFFRVIGGWVS